MRAMPTEGKTMTATTQGSDLETAATPRFLGLRLSALMFIAFAIMGAWLPVFSRHLQSLRFAPDAMAWASASNAIGAMIAPLIWGQIADRWLSPPRCISLCALATGVLLLVLAGLTDAASVIAASIAVWFFLIPVLGLTGAYIFRQLEHPEREYGHIRLWGTIGWAAANWCLTLWFKVGEFSESNRTKAANLTDSMRLGALAAFVLAIYALTVPHAPVGGDPFDVRKRTWLARLADAPLAALQLFRLPAFLVYCVSMFGLYVTVPFTVQLNPLLLGSLGVKDDVMPAYLTLSQATEVLCLALLPSLLARFGLKVTMAAGGLAWSVGLALLSVGEPLWLVLCALPASGVFICCFVIAGQVFVNRQASSDIRASAQGLLILINGSGLLLGHLLVGWIRDVSGRDSYATAYGVAAGVSAVLLVIFLVGFTTKSGLPDGLPARI
jgi:MFS family permease